MRITRSLFGRRKRAAIRRRGLNRVPWPEGRSDAQIMSDLERAIAKGAGQ
ncbi:MAG: hypothetical protein RJS97_14350 [Parvibaculaceae bacterium]